MTNTPRVKDPIKPFKWTQLKYLIIFVAVFILSEVTDAFVPPPGEHNQNDFMPLYLQSLNDETPLDYAPTVSLLKENQGNDAAATEGERSFPINFHTFKDYRTQKVYYVDKTEMIRAFIHNGYYLLTTRPRGFGKTTNLSMLDAFLNKFKDSKSLFTGLKISGYKSFCTQHKNKYVVIHLDFKGVEMPTFSEMELQIAKKFTDVLRELWNKISWQYTKKTARERKEANLFNGPSVTIDEVLSGFRLFMSELKEQRQRFVVFMDDFDAPFLHAFNMDRSPNKSKGELLATEFYARVKDLMRRILIRFFNTGFANPFRGLVTGVFAMENLFSDLNTSLNTTLKYSVLRDTMLDPYFGFTEKEVQKVIRKSGSSISYDHLEAYYAGYRHSNSNSSSGVFNPASVIAAFNSNKLRSYWPDKGPFSLIEGALKISGSYGLIHMKLLTMGWSFQKKVHTELIYPTIETDEETFWTLLAHSGYIIDVQPSEIKNKARTAETINSEWVLPNIEVKEFLESNVKFPNFKNFANSLKHQNQTEFRKELSELHHNLGPYFNASKRENASEYGPFMMKLASCVFPDYNITEVDVKEHASLYMLAVRDLKTPNEETYIFSIVSALPNTTESQTENVMKDQMKDFFGRKPEVRDNPKSTQIVIMLTKANPVVAITKF